MELPDDDDDDDDEDNDDDDDGDGDEEYHRCFPEDLRGGRVVFSKIW